MARKTSVKKTSTSIRKERTHKSLFHFFSNLDQLGEDKTRVFQLIDKPIPALSDIPFELYFEGAMSLLTHAQKHFVKLRDDNLLLWLIKHLHTKHPYPNPNAYPCLIDTLLHTISFPFVSKEVLSIFIETKGNHLDFNKVQETFLLNHPDLSVVDDSIILISNQRDNTIKIHFEVQREKHLSPHEIIHLKSELLQLVHKYSELKQPQFSVPSNRELLVKSFNWIMRDLEAHDLHHVFIDFTQQIGNHFKFSVLVCHILSSQKASLETLLSHPDVHIDGISSYQEKALTKQGAMLTVDIHISSFPSIPAARKKCCQLLHSLIGSFRDVNGGLLEKIEDNFLKLAEEVPAPLDELRPFFYGITPQEKQAIAPINLLKALFNALVQQKYSSNEFSYTLYEDQEVFCVTIKATHPDFEKEYRHFLTRKFSTLFSSSLSLNDCSIVSCGTQKTSHIETEKLKKHTFKFYKAWTEKRDVKQVLKLGCASDFISFDPRIGSQEEASHLLKMLFEGLTRIGPEGTPQKALAKSIEISSSGLCYRFYLKESYWSNGLPLTAHDFEYSWKTSLDPNFSSLLSYLFYPIKNAKAIKTGTLPKSELGVKALNNLTLEVILEHPTPYFLDLCAHSTFSPVCKKIDLINPSWPSAKGKRFICNGPFTFGVEESIDNILLIRNPSYHHQQKIHLEKICISKIPEQEAHALLENKKLDLNLYPFCRQYINSPLKRDDIKLKAGVLENRYLSFDCKYPLFSSQKLREAFSLAIDQSILAPFYSQNATPQYTIYSPALSQLQLEHTDHTNLKKAQILFEEFCAETNNHKNALNSEKIYTIKNLEHSTQVLVSQLNHAFNLTLDVAIVNNSELFKLIYKKKIHLFLFSWINRIKDPSYFLETFSSSSGMINYAQWESKEMNLLIQSIQNEPCLKLRNALHLQAELILQKEKPLIPLVSTQIHSSIPQNIKGVRVTDSQNFDVCFSRKA